MTDHRAPSEGSRDPDYWGPACVAVPNLDVYGHVLDADYELAVVIAEMNGQKVDGPFAVTLFGAPSAGEFLWADANGDMEADALSTELQARGLRTISCSDRA